MANNQRMTLQAKAYYEHIARRLLAHQPPAEIASAVGISKTQLARIMSRKEFQDFLAALSDKIYGEIDKILYDQRADLRTRIEAGAPLALSRIFNLIEHSRSDREKGINARWVMESLGYGPVEKRVQANLVASDLDAEQRASIKDAIRAALSSGDVIVDSDVVPELPEKEPLAALEAKLASSESENA